MRKSKKVVHVDQGANVAPGHNDSVWEWEGEVFLSMREASKELGISYASVVQRIKHKSLKAIRINNRPWIPDFEVLRLLLSMRNSRHKKIPIYTIWIQEQGEFQTWRKEKALAAMDFFGQGQFSVDYGVASLIDQRKIHDGHEFLVKDGYLFEKWTLDDDHVYFSPWPPNVREEKIMPKEKFQKIKTAFLKEGKIFLEREFGNGPQDETK